MSTASFRHVTFVCVLLVQLAAYHALPTTSGSVSLISREASIQPGLKSLQKETVQIEGNKYTAVPLNEQGHYSHSYKLEPAFKYQDREEVPAILKRVSDQVSEENKTNSRAYQEIGFLKRKSVGLYLFHKWSSSKNEEGLYDVDIIIKDIGAADPPFKPLHMWYKEDPSIDVYQALAYARDNTEDVLLRYAKEEQLLYEDHTVRNLFFRKTALLQYINPEEAKLEGIEGAVMPTDWGPKTNYTGVMDVAGKDNSTTSIQEYSEDLYIHLKETLTVEQLAYQLWIQGDDLRGEDYYWKTLRVNDDEHSERVYCRHLHIKTTEPDEDGNKAYIYKVVDGVVLDRNEKPIKKYDGFLGKSALLTISTIGTDSDEEITSLQKDGMLLNVEDDEDENEVYIVYSDKRRHVDMPEKMKEWAEWEAVEYAGGGGGSTTATNNSTASIPNV